MNAIDPDGRMYVVSLDQITRCYGTIATRNANWQGDAAPVLKARRLAGWAQAWIFNHMPEYSFVIEVMLFIATRRTIGRRRLSVNKSNNTHLCSRHELSPNEYLVLSRIRGRVWKTVALLVCVEGARKRIDTVECLYPLQPCWKVDICAS